MNEDKRIIEDTENKIYNEKNVDIKKTISKFIKDDEPVLSQVEAIKEYSEYKKKKKKNNYDDEMDTSEEEQHLSRVKQELLESLKRVERLEKQIFEQESKTVDKLKVNKKGKGGGKQGVQDRNMDMRMEKKEKEREE